MIDPKDIFLESVPIKAPRLPRHVSYVCKHNKHERCGGRVFIGGERVVACNCAKCNHPPIDENLESGKLAQRRVGR